MISNADITIFNKRLDTEQRTDMYYPTRIKGVSYYKRRGVSAGNQSMSTNNTHTIRIPIDADTEKKKYTDETTYKSLSADEFVKYWTIQPGAIIVKALVESDDPVREIELEEKYGEIIRVVDFTENTDRCSEQSKHWRIGGI